MKRLLILFVLLTMKLSYAGTPHIVYGTLKNNNGTVPANGEVTFRAYITSRPSEVLTQGSTGCGYTNGYWNVGVGNFNSAWTPGEVLKVELHHVVDNVNITDQVELTSQGADNAGQSMFPSVIENQKTLTISVRPQDAGSTSPSVGSHQYNSGSIINISATPLQDYVFSHWEGDVANPNNSNTSVTLNSNKTIKAVFLAPKYELKLYASPRTGGRTNPSVGQVVLVEKGAHYAIKAIPADGYQFSHWSGDVKNVQDIHASSTTVMMYWNYNITANFQHVVTPKHILDISSSPGNGGTTRPSNGQHEYNYGMGLNISAIPAQGYEFVNWTGNVTNPSNANTTLTMNADKTVIANFKIMKMALSLGVHPDGSGRTTPEIGNHLYDYGSIVSISAVPNQGYEFVSWIGDVENTNSASTTITLESNQSIEAQFRLIKKILTIDVNVQDGGIITPGVGIHQYDYNEIINIEATPLEGYEFVDWTGDVSDPSSAHTTVLMDDDKTVKANFKLVNHVLSITSFPENGGSTVPAAGIHNYDHNAIVNISAVSSDGYRFVNWTGDVENTESTTTTIIMNSDKAVIANYELMPPNEFVLSMAVNIDSGGTVFPPIGEHVFIEDTTIAISAIPATEFQFLSWTGAVENSDSATTTVKMTGDKIVQANFQPIPRVLSMDVFPESSGETTPAIGQYVYDHGSQIEIAALPADGYEFANWSGDVVNADSSKTVVIMDTNKSIIANFQTIKYTLTLIAVPQKGGTLLPAMGDMEFELGEIVQLKATAAVGYEFAAWLGDVANPILDSTTVIMDNDKIIIATFNSLDIQAPVLKFAYPQNQSVAVPQNCKIQFKIIDPNDGDGIDESSLDVHLNDQALWIQGEDQTNGRAVVRRGSLQFEYQPELLFEPETHVRIDISCADMALIPNVMDTSYSFTTGTSDVQINKTTAVDTTGGVVVDDDTGVEITIPENAVSDSIEISIGTINNPPPLPDSTDGFGLTYHFSPDGIQFEDSVVIKIPYTQQDLDDAGITDPLGLRLYYFLSSKGEWVSLKVFDADEAYVYVKVKEFCYLRVGKSALSNVSRPGAIPNKFALFQNYPNPFNPTTDIVYQLSKRQYVSIEICDIQGRVVQTLVKEYNEAGEHRIKWDARDHSGQRVMSGVYLCRMKAGSYVFTKKMLLVK